MSWSSPLDRLAPMRGALALVAALPLAGCFTPMYSSMGGRLGSELQAVAVDPVPDRLGHYLHDQLITNLNGTGASVAPKYRLTLSYQENVQTALIETATGRPQSGTVVANVNWTLTRLDTSTVMAKGTVTSSASYDRSEQRYANIAASHDAEIRDAKTLADQITTRVAASLASPRSDQADGNVATTNALSAAAPVPPSADRDSDATTVPPQ